MSVTVGDGGVAGAGTGRAAGGDAGGDGDGGGELDAVMVADYLKVRDDDELRDTLRIWKLQSKNKRNFYGVQPAKFKERVVFSVELVKMNRKGKSQKRALIVSNLALYNFKVGDYGSFKRRIPIPDVGKVFKVKEDPKSFVLHTWEPAFDYDYRYQAKEAGQVETLIGVLKDHFSRLVGEELVVEDVSEKDLGSKMQTKATVDARRKAAVQEDADKLAARHSQVATALQEHLAPAPKLGSLLSDNLLNEMIEEDEEDDDEDDSGGGRRGRTATIVLPPPPPSDSDSDPDSEDEAGATIAPIKEEPEPADAVSGTGAGGSGSGGGGTDADPAGEAAVAPEPVSAGTGAVRRRSGRTKTKERRATGFVSSGSGGGLAIAAAAARGGPIEPTKSPSAEVEPVQWVSKVDPGSGATYYVNPQTGESSWQLPEGAVAVKFVKSGDSAPASDATSSSTGSDAGAAARTFTQHVDPTSGATFYVDTATQESLWELPAGAVVTNA